MTKGTVRTQEQLSPDARGEELQNISSKDKKPGDVNSGKTQVDQDQVRKELVFHTKVVQISELQRWHRNLEHTLSLQAIQIQFQAPTQDGS